ncbi:MAG: 50S ribosomal protein L11 methyltransferase [Deltaproteobacteria bacterium]|nr:50S ribosomal protein L11 methyltransferase [Deltaproteobacteria bacterium]
MDSLTRNTKQACCPYRDLYIYLVQGRVGQEDEVCLGEAFLGNWVEEEYSFLFFSSPSRDRIARLLAGRGDLAFVEEHHFPYEQWQGGGLEPLRIGPFLIETPWERAEAGGEKLRIILDPGVVFGTGLHPTTRDCLSALAWLGERVCSGSVLDIGTGSGLLAIAAARLGAREVTAVDLNPLCVKTARRNVGLNHLEGVVRVVEGDAKDYLRGNRDVVLANIHPEVIGGLLNNLRVLSAEWLILSGLMRTQARDVRTAIKRLGVRLIQEWDHEMTWYTLLVRK